MAAQRFRLWSSATYKSAPPSPRRRVWRNPIFLTVAVIAVLVTAGIGSYFVWVQQGCGSPLVGCGPYAYPAIQNARVTFVGGGSCQTTSTLDSTLAVCRVFMKAGATGNVTVNMIEENLRSGQGARGVQFLVHSSDDRSINFTTIPTCAYTSAPTWSSPSCGMGSQTQTFEFDFVVSPNYVAPPSNVVPEPASITVVVYESCCLP